MFDGMGAYLWSVYPKFLILPERILLEHRHFERRRFFVGARISQAPLPVSPVHQQSLSNRDVLFRWTPPLGATHVQLSVSKVSTSEVVLDTLVSGSEIRYLLEPNTLYWYTLKGRAGEDEGPISALAIFATGTSILVDTEDEGSASTWFRVLQNPVVDRLAVAHRSASPSRFALYDVLGREVWHTEAEAGTGRVEMDRGGLSSGVYVLRVVQGETVATRTVVLR